MPNTEYTSKMKMHKQPITDRNNLHIYSNKLCGLTKILGVSLNWGSRGPMGYMGPNWVMVISLLYDPIRAHIAHKATRTPPYRWVMVILPS